MILLKNIIDQVVLGDCMEIMPTLPDKCVDMTLTDIPYGECNKPSGGLRILDKGDANTCDFDLIEFVRHLKRITRGSIYIFCGIEQISTLFAEISKDMSARLCHWEKTNPSPMNGQYLWLSATENCVFGKFPNAIFNEMCHSNIWRFPCGKSKIHPTEKPVELIKHLLKTSSDIGDIVFDPCIGSGTTAIAAQWLMRQYVGIEQNTTYYHQCINRIKKERATDLFRQ